MVVEYTPPRRVGGVVGVWCGVDVEWRGVCRVVGVFAGSLSDPLPPFVEYGCSERRGGVRFSRKHGQHSMLLTCFWIAYGLIMNEVTYTLP